MIPPGFAPAKTPSSRWTPSALARGAPVGDLAWALTDGLYAAEGELVLFTQGSSARLAPNMKSAPVDAVVVGIVDTVDALGQVIYDAKTDGQA